LKRAPRRYSCGFDANGSEPSGETQASDPRLAVAAQANANGAILCDGDDRSERLVSDAGVMQATGPAPQVRSLGL
jgi:hypothetical protein